MTQAHVTLAYKQIFDIHSKGSFELNIFNDSYQEFLIQVQSFDTKRQYKTWEELRTAIPKANVNVQYKTGFAIGRYVRELNNKIPGLKDNLDRWPVPFSTHEFEILASDIQDKSAHRVAIVYNTDPVTLINTVGDYFVCAEGNHVETVPGVVIDTFMLRTQPNLSITSYQTAPHFKK